MKRYLGRKLLPWIAVFLIALLWIEMPVEATTEKVMIQQTESDKKVIPDKYNTGAHGELRKVGLGETINGVDISVSGDGVTNVIDLYYRNKTIIGTVIFENMDFSEHTLNFYNTEKVERNITLVFRNCKFSFVSFAKARCPVTVEFENCTFLRFIGGNAVFNKCRFGEWYQDGMVPFQNVVVKNCFFGDFTSKSTDAGEIHIDGTQIYGSTDIDVKNVSFSNCRFEVPYIRPQGSTAYVNACIMLQMEFSNAANVRFTDCVVNGGGYCVYARAKKGDYELRNVFFSDLSFGCANLYGKFYGDIAGSVMLKNLKNTDKLYVGAVWKDEGSTHLSVTNDTNQTRKLIVVTDSGKREFTIPACPSGSELKSILDNGEKITYADMPFDRDIVIEEDCKYVVCYDATIEGAARQIRFVNWTKEDVYLDKNTLDTLIGDTEGILSKGACGENVTYTLSKSGVLTLSGTGTTYDYHSQKLAPWSEYGDFVKEIVVETGVERVGNQLFRSCTGVAKLTLSEGVKAIGGRTFNGCSCLTEIILPASICSIGDAAFAGVPLREVYYNGSDWAEVTVGTGNEVWIEIVEIESLNEERGKLWWHLKRRNALPYK